MKKEVFRTPFIPIEGDDENQNIASITHTINEYIKQIIGLEVYWVNIKCDISNPDKKNGYFVLIKESEGNESENELDESGSGIKIKMLQQK